MQFCFSCFIKTALVSSNQVRYELLFWNLLVFSTFSNISSNIWALQRNSHDFGLYSSWVFNSKCCFAWFHFKISPIFFCLAPAFQASSFNCLLSPQWPLLQLCGCWLLIILAVSVLKSHCLFCTLCYFILCSSGILIPISSIYLNYL